MNAYKRNILELFQTFHRVLQPETLFIWTTSLPVAQTVRGGVILDTIRFLSDVLRFDILLANDFTSHAAVDCGFDVMDLHYEMRRHIGLRLNDGIHWNSQAHRKISGLLLHHICTAWDIILPMRISVAFGAMSIGQSNGTKKSNDSAPEKSVAFGAVSIGESNGTKKWSEFPPEKPDAFGGMSIGQTNGKQKSSESLSEKPNNADDSRGAMLDFMTSRCSRTSELGHSGGESRQRKGPLLLTPDSFPSDLGQSGPETQQRKGPLLLTPESFPLQESSASDLGQSGADTQQRKGPLLSTPDSFLLQEPSVSNNTDPRHRIQPLLELPTAGIQRVK